MMTRFQQQGALLKDNGACEFRVWAPFRKNVTLLLLGGEDVAYPLTPEKNGYWTTTVENVTAGTHYYYLLDEQLQRPDPASRRQESSVHHASCVTDPNSFDFTDQDWKGLSPEKLIIYEIHIGAFTPEGTFQAARERLPALEALGITAIELMPVSQFSGDRNWGYDSVYPFALHNRYGTTDDFKALINTAHHLGMAVILDVVYCRTGPEGNYLPDYGPYFTEKYQTHWGPGVNFDDAWCDPVRDFYIQNALMWLDEFHIDGLRLDALDTCQDNSARHFAWELADAVAELEQQTGRRKLLITATDRNDPRYTNPVAIGGYGFTAQWADEFHHALHALLTGETQGYYEDFGQLSHLAQAFTQAFVYTGQYSPYRKRKFGRPLRDNDARHFIVFSQNHEQAGNRMLGERLSALVSFEALKLAAATVILSPFIPLLFMGEEYGEKNPFLFFTSHSDPDLAEKIKKDRSRGFSAFFNTSKSIPDPQLEDTFRRSCLQWDQTLPPNAAMLACYRFLIAFRKHRPAMQTGDQASLQIYPAGELPLLIIKRTSGQDAVLILLNFDKAVQTYHHMAPTPLKKIFDSAHEMWNGPGVKAVDEVLENEPILLQPFSAVVYEMAHHEE
ncbi:malto-oligosyltrehalose trehalohydrolase [Chitinophaga qingshengii]|uniref:Malto-oligosyltrehalose trehalohydrolase n=1 Tax=Chitinophaga qingshengii TaxID=1569794 RepID=A0ABR7TSM9_9BACT|nr:malto-oligosyltrehalose trehalohydrolase [Chitinophaga qingshengii]MBC9933487.1 malto-oligosyltrehalose trehalohydrolase [Chitinophaga qingshengii]